MGAVRLGKILLRWCWSCNIPIVASKTCHICSNDTVEVSITPPGDARPAFRADLDLIESVIDRQFGEGCGKLLLNERSVILLNKAPDLDRMDEVILDGGVTGALRFVPGKGFSFLPRLGFANRFVKCATKGRIFVDDGAIESIKKGASALAIGILKVDDLIEKGDEILVLSKANQLLATGRATMNGNEMLQANRGPGVKSRWCVAKSPAVPEVADKDPSWEEVIEANQPEMDRMISKSVSFIRKTVDIQNLPVAVAFSGGKDSLVTLYLVLEAGVKPTLMFTDTGLEFPETIDQVQIAADRNELDLLVEHASFEHFCNALPLFGPPARDFRWCCKTNKLGPTSRQIARNFPNGVLSFIGQRRYESESRAKHGRIWRNPWVPGQVAASPIQDWTALHIWIYIFGNDLEYNPWYDRGLERIGCFLCPAADIAELDTIKTQTDKFKKFAKFLTEWAEKRNLPEGWLENHLWRWKKIPKGILELLDLDESEMHSSTESPEGLNFTLAKGYVPCTGGLSAEGAFSRPINLSQAANVLQILGAVSHTPNEGMLSVLDSIVFQEGAVVVKGKDEAQLEMRTRDIREMIFRSELCVGCGVCIGRCPTGALELVNDKIFVDKEKCTHCHKCFGPCPVIDFRTHQEFNH